jgi:hypothetical protein
MGASGQSQVLALLGLVINSKVQEMDILVSSDVFSLFTKVPLQLLLQHFYNQSIAVIRHFLIIM